MNLGYIDREIARRNRETPDTTAGRDPFGRRQAILDAADEVAERTGCLYGDRTAAVTAGEDYCCLPVFYRVKVVGFMDATGNRKPLRIFQTSLEADSTLGMHWRTDPSADPPRDAVFQAVNAVRLHPVPSISRAGALLMEGYWKPGNVWKYEEDEDGNEQPLDIADDQDCPLPEWSHEAVLALARLTRTEEDDRPEIRSLSQILERRYNRLLGDVAMNAALHHSRTNARGRCR